MNEETSVVDLEKQIDSEFFSLNFKPEQYVKDLFIKGGPLKAKLKSTQLNESKSLTSDELIKNVYTNYQKFIDTSQQISRKRMKKTPFFLILNYSFLFFRIGNRYASIEKHGWRL